MNGVGVNPEIPTGSASLLARRDRVVPVGIPRATDRTVARGAGAHLFDLEGERLIDFAGGIGVANAGHAPREVIEAISAQAQRVLHASFHVVTYEPYIALCERLVELLPHGDATKAMLLNSGAEAVENAIKIARQATGRSGVICFSGAFHGRTLLGMTLTSKVGYKRGCGPFAPEIYRLPFPDHYHDGDGLDLQSFVDRELARFETALLTHVSPRDLAAVIIEPVLGEGGFIPAPKAYLEGLRRICDTHGTMLIFDEVQTGFGRTGHWGAYQHYGVTPDISTWAKALGGGLPISAVIGRAEIMDAAVSGTIGSTFGGNPVACAAALATIDLMEKQKLNARAQRIGAKVFERFRALQSKCSSVGDVRGLGAMVGMELVEDRDPKRPATLLTTKVLSQALARGLVVISAGVHGNVIRVLSPLVISDEDLDRGLDIIGEEILGSAP